MSNLLLSAIDNIVPPIIIGLPVYKDNEIADESAPYIRQHIQLGQTTPTTIGSHVREEMRGILSLTVYYPRRDGQDTSIADELAALTRMQVYNSQPQQPSPNPSQPVDGANVKSQLLRQVIRFNTPEIRDIEDGHSGQRRLVVTNAFVAESIWDTV